MSTWAALYIGQPLPLGLRDPPAEGHPRLGGRPLLLKVVFPLRSRPLALLLRGALVPHRSRRSDREHRDAMGQGGNSKFWLEFLLR